MRPSISISIVLKARLQSEASPMMLVRGHARLSLIDARTTSDAWRSVFCVFHHAQNPAPCKTYPKVLPAAAHQRTCSLFPLAIARNARMLRGTTVLASPTRKSCSLPHAAQSSETAYNTPTDEKTKRKAFRLV